MNQLARFANFFKAISGFDPLPFQERAAEAILAGRNVVLTAPTGAGKTLAVLAPFLFATEEGTPVGDRLLYALPLRSLASSLWRQARDTSGLESDAVRLQTGSAQEDPFFRGRITFTTIDQLLSSYLTVPVSLGRRLGNINSGALLGGLVTFDEVHLLDPGQALGTAIEMARRLYGLTQVVMMTATLPGSCLAQLCSVLHAEHVSLTGEDIRRAPHLGDRDRRWTWVSHPLEVDDILREHHAGRTLVVCNSVARAQALYRALSARLATDCLRTRSVLLHSRFLPEHREPIEADLEAVFGKHAEVTDVIGVTTQVIEAGMDWGADTLHAELAPANTLVQRAGRCARFAAPRNVGRVFVYELERSKDGRPRLGPYRERADEIEETRRCLMSVRDSQMNSLREGDLVERVHARADAALLGGAIDNLPHRTTEIQRRMFEGGEIAALSELVRDVDSVNVVVTDQPGTIDLEKGPRSIGVPRTSLWALEPAMSRSAGPNRAAAPRMDENGVVTWQPLSTFAEIRSAPWFLALSPQLASYSPEFGLSLGEAGTSFGVTYVNRPPRLAPQYRLERWEDHAQRVWKAAEASRSLWATGAMRLDTSYGLPAGTAAAALRLVCLLHDLGKLSRPWQEIMQRWQREKNPRGLTDLQGAPIAHTDYDPQSDRPRQRATGNPPPHAMEGAYAAVRIGRGFGIEVDADGDARRGLVRAMLTAVGRHHGPRTAQITAFLWSADWQPMLRRTIGALAEDGVLELQAQDHVRAERFKSSIILDATMPEDATWLPMYWFLVRNLRLADQASQASRQG